MQSTGGCGPQEGSLGLVLQSIGPGGGGTLEHSDEVDPSSHVAGGGGSSIGGVGGFGSSVFRLLLSPSVPPVLSPTPLPLVPPLLPHPPSSLLPPPSLPPLLLPPSLLSALPPSLLSPPEDPSDFVA